MDLKEAKLILIGISGDKNQNEAIHTVMKAFDNLETFISNQEAKSIKKHEERKMIESSRISVDLADLKNAVFLQ